MRKSNEGRGRLTPCSDLRESLATAGPSGVLEPAQMGLRGPAVGLSSRLHAGDFTLATTLETSKRLQTGVSSFQRASCQVSGSTPLGESSWLHF